MMRGMMMLLIQAITRFAAMLAYSGTVTTANVSQQAVPANSDRVYLSCQAPAANTAPIYLDFGRSAAIGTGLELAPGGSVTFASAIPMTSITVTSGTVAQAWRCREGSNQ